MQSTQPIYYNTAMLLDKYKNYAFPESRISYLVKTGKLIRIRRGLYVFSQENNVSEMCLANIICSPSYISFASALRYHGFIPERVVSITSAIYGKTKNKIFRTPFGTFLYYYVNPKTYSYGFVRVKEPFGSFLMATPEKALLDTLSKIPRKSSLGEFEELLEQDLRIDVQAVLNLSIARLQEYVKWYHQGNTQMLIEWIRKVRS